MSDMVNHPSHYTDGSIEVIDFIEDKQLNYHRGNALKYLCRAGKKDPDKEDLLQEIARLKEELRSKSLDLKRAEMARDVYERMILLAEERYGIPIRKKSGAK